jgi:hypothetical protein
MLRHDRAVNVVESSTGRPTAARAAWASATDGATAV